jgi:hypothetical protein
MASSIEPWKHELQKILTPGWTGFSLNTINMGPLLVLQL